MPSLPKSLFACSMLLLLLSPALAMAAGEDPPPEPVTTGDVAIPLDELELLLKPLPKGQLLIEAGAWQGLVQAKSEEIAQGQIEVKRGIMAFGGATLRLPTQCGWGNAMRYLLTGDEFSAQDAYRMGMIQEVVPVGQQLEHAIAIAQTIAEQAPLGIYATLKSARIVMDAIEAEAKTRLMPDIIPIMQSEDAEEGVQSFVERRKAEFKGK